MSDKPSTQRIDNPAQLETAIAALALSNLRRLWGGRLPTWEEFKQAHKDGRVETNKTIASKALSFPGVPKAWYIIYGIITPWGMFVVPILAITLYLFGYVNGWIVLGSPLVAWALYKVTFIGACYGILDGAEADEKLYQFLLSNGAFIFGPSKITK